MEVMLLFGMIIGLLVIGVPVAVALGLSSVLFLLWFSDSSLASVAQTLFNAFEGHYTLLAVPFFILASAFMSTGGVAQRIIRFSIACVGHFPGGLAIAGVFSCMLFAALSGSSPATVVAIGSIVIGGMRQVGYSKEFAAGVICNAGTLGILIPPSIVMVVYAAAVEVSVGRMFLAGVIPGLLAGFMLMATIFIIARVRNLPKGEWQGWREVFESGKAAGWGLFLIFIILGGIYGGVFTPTEAAAVAAVYAFVIATFVYRDMGPLSRTHESLFTRPWAFFSAFVHADTRKTLLDAGKLTVTLLFVIANALILKHVLTEEQIPQQITEALLGVGFGPVMFLVAVNVILLIGGQFMEPSGLLVIVAPLVFPIAMELGIDPIHLGIIMVVNMENWDDYAARWAESLCDERNCADANDAGCSSRFAIPLRSCRLSDFDYLCSLAFNRLTKRCNGTRNHYEIGQEAVFKGLFYSAAFYDDAILYLDLEGQRGLMMGNP